MPFHGNDVTQAPAMAGLAESGVVFDNAYTASPLCTPARGVADDGAPPVPHTVLRQRRRLLLGDPDLRPPPAHAGLPDGARGQDALLRAGPAARLRGAAHHRHLPGRLRLDAGLGLRRSGRTGTTTCRRSPRPAPASAPTSSTSTTRSGTPPSAGCSSTSGPVTSGRSASWCPSPIRTTRTRSPRSTGTATAVRTSRCPPTATTPRSPRRTRSACATSAPWTTSRSPTRWSATPATPTSVRCPTSTTTSPGCSTSCGSPAGSRTPW